ncbi:Uncharacterised protein [Streptococcus pneumoniae]|nr:Uncharacterised protein [Streptococcus pneumoniae]
MVQEIAQEIIRSARKKGTIGSCSARSLLPEINRGRRNR